MKVTYIGHSGFLVETGAVNILFDYSEGDLPQVNTEVPFLVLVSHAHKDHYNPAVFALAKQYQNIRFILSKDVRILEEVKREYDLSETFLENQVIFVPAGL